MSDHFLVPAQPGCCPGKNGRKTAVVAAVNVHRRICYDKQKLILLLELEDNILNLNINKNDSSV